MISTQQEEVSRVFNLVGQKQTDDLEGEFAPVDIVAQKEIVGVRGILSMVEKSEQIRVLAMYVA